MAAAAKSKPKTTTTLSPDRLKALGAKRLAELLMEAAEQDAALKRRLKLELAEKDAPESVPAHVRKRLTQLAQARAFVDWRGTGKVAADLDETRRAIVERVAKLDPAQGLDLMWRFMSLADPIYGRCDDSNGVVGAVFAAACADLGALAQAAQSDAAALADHAFVALRDNGYGEYDGLIAVLAPALGRGGLERLRERFVELSRTLVERPPDAERRVVGMALGASSRRPIYADDLDARRRESAIRLGLRDIADALGDVDGFIAAIDPQAKKSPKIAADIAGRLVAAGRAGEALAALDAAEPRGSWPDFEWEDARIEAFEALGRGAQAQAARWSCFERALSATHLRAFLKQLPDFDDIEAEERALDYAEGYKSALQALSFLARWPALERAERFILARACELDGDHYEILAPAADALAEKHALAATLLLRSMIDFTLQKARSSRYTHAARHLAECAALASTIADWRGVETHAAYAARLKANHPRKSGFWSLAAR